MNAGVELGAPVEPGAPPVSYPLEVAGRKRHQAEETEDLRQHLSALIHDTISRCCAQPGAQCPYDDDEVRRITDAVLDLVKAERDTKDRAARGWKARAEWLEASEEKARADAERYKWGTSYWETETARLEAEAALTEARGDNPSGFWSQRAWEDWSNTLAGLIPDGDEGEYSNPEGSQEGIIEDCLRTYTRQLAAVRAYEPCQGAGERRDRHVLYCVPFYQWRDALLEGSSL